MTARLPISVEQPMPVRFAEMLWWQAVGDLLERASQPHEIAVAPHPGPHEPAAIEIEQVHQIVADEQDVVRVQIGVAHAEVVKHAQAAADGDPAENRNAAPTQERGERLRIEQPLGDEVRGVEQAMAPIARRDRRRHGQPRAMQVIEQLPLAERARFGFAAPQITVAHHARNETAAPIVAQHVVLAAAAYEVSGAAAARFAFDLAALAPIPSVEPGSRYVAHAGGVI